MTKSTMRENQKQLPSPETMFINCIVGEFLHGNPDSTRKKQLLNAIYARAVNPDTIKNWIDGLKICQGEKFFPEAIMVKIQGVVQFIESEISISNHLLKEICSSKELPPQIVKAARTRCKIENKKQ